MAKKTKWGGAFLPVYLGSVRLALVRHNQQSPFPRTCEQQRSRRGKIDQHSYVALHWGASGTPRSPRSESALLEVNYRHGRNQDPTDHDVTVVEMSGRLRLGNSRMYAENSIHRLIDGGTRKLVIDLARLDYLDSSGLGMLIGCGGRMGAERRPDARRGRRWSGGTGI